MRKLIFIYFMAFVSIEAFVGHLVLHETHLALVSPQDPETDWSATRRVLLATQPSRPLLPPVLRPTNIYMKYVVPSIKERCVCFLRTLDQWRVCWGDFANENAPTDKDSLIDCACKLIPLLLWKGAIDVYQKSS